MEAMSPLRISRVLLFASIVLAICGSVHGAKKTKGKGKVKRSSGGGGGPCGADADPDGMFEEGFARGKGGDFPGAAECFDSFVARRPDELRGWLVLSEVLARDKKHTKSLAAAQSAKKVDPASAEAHFLYGSALMALHEYLAAKQAFSSALSHDPKHVGSLTNLGSLLGNLNDHPGAISMYKRALHVDPSMWPAKHNLGTALHSLKRFEEAKIVLQEVAAAEPRCFECALSLANTLRESKEMDAAVEQYQVALVLNPASNEALLHYYTTAQELLLWDEIHDMWEVVREVTLEQLARGELTTVKPYYSLLNPFEPEAMLGIAQAHARETAAKMASVGASMSIVQPPLPLSGKPLRVGFIMADFRQHVTAHLLQTVFAHFDPARIEAHCFALNPDDRDSFRRRIVASVGSARFHEVAGQSDQDVASLINRGGVHVLVDMDYNKERLSILALRPAPVIVSFLAHPGTTGASFVDHVVFDQVVAPPELTPFLSEKLVYMKHHYQVNDHRASYPFSEPDVRAIRAREKLPGDATVMANFNGLYKIEPRVFRLWTQMLSALPSTVLWLVSAGGSSDDNIRAEAGNLSSRLVLAQPRDFADHIRRAAAADLFLDSFTYNAHTTAVDAIWGGVPVVTLPGEKVNSRLAAGVLAALGPGSETLVRTEEEYVALASRLLSQPRVRARVRAWLALGGRQGLETRPLFDTKGWVQDFQGCLLNLVELYAIRGGPASQERGGARGVGGGGMHFVRAYRKEWGWPFARGARGG